jgi:hypothetical protein
MALCEQIISRGAKRIKEQKEVKEISSLFALRPLCEHFISRKVAEEAKAQRGQIKHFHFPA